MDDLPASGDRARTRARRRRSRRSALLLLVPPAALWVGCSVEKNYDVLSFFFDGVPDPNAPPGTRAGGRRDPRAFYYTHKPFVDGACMQCHNSPAQFAMSIDDSSMCLKCHASIVDEYPMMHGPVAGVACLWCHEPHESTIPGLLRARGPELCLQCHGLELSIDPQPLVHQDLTRDCLACHDAHGGDDRYFLISPPAERPAPAIEPPSEPTAEGGS